MTDKHNTKHNTLISEQPLYPCPVVNFHISGTKWATDTVGQLRDDPGHSGTIGKHTSSLPAESFRRRRPCWIESCSPVEYKDVRWWSWITTWHL